MSTNEEKVVKEMLEYIADEDMNIWELYDCLKKKEEQKILIGSTFTLRQMVVLVAIIRCIVEAIKFHSKDDDQAHPDITKVLYKLKGQFKVHRHDTSKLFTDKAVY